MDELKQFHVQIPLSTQTLNVIMILKHVDFSALFYCLCIHMSQQTFYGVKFYLLSRLSVYSRAGSPITGTSWPVPVGAVAHVPFIKINGLKLEIISEIRFYVDLINPFRPVLSYGLRLIFAK